MSTNNGTAATTTNNTTTIKEWTYYKGKVTAQRWIEYNAQKDMALELSVTLTGTLSDNNNPKSTITPLAAPTQITSLLKFPPDQQGLQKTVKRLRQLGFTDKSLERLNIGGKKSHSFVGVETLFQALPPDEKGRTFFNVASPKERDALTPEQTRTYLEGLEGLFSEAADAYAESTSGSIPF